jgi:hypothetical protein
VEKIMNKPEIEQIVASALADLIKVYNLNGIIIENLQQCIVSPYEVAVYPDDGIENNAQKMWVVLKAPSQDGYLVGYDPVVCAWAVLERTPNKKCPFIQITTNETLAEALSSM